MKVLVWLNEGIWAPAVDAARDAAGPRDSFTLLHVLDPSSVAGARGAYAGLLGRGARVDPGALIAASEEAAGNELLAAAARRLGRPARPVVRRGRIEQAVVAACADADLLVAARDGDTRRPGPHSLGRAGRFVVDHAPCAVLLVWPGEAPPPQKPQAPPHPRP